MRVPKADGRREDGVGDVERNGGFGSDVGWRRVGRIRAVTVGNGSENGTD